MSKVLLFPHQRLLSGYAGPRDASRWTPARCQEYLIRLFDAIGTWQDRAASRRRLSGLDDRMLCDVGLDRAAADTEAAKPFWRA